MVGFRVSVTLSVTGHDWSHGTCMTTRIRLGTARFALPTTSSIQSLPGTTAPTCGVVSPCLIQLLHIPWASSMDLSDAKEIAPLQRLLLEASITSCFNTHTHTHMFFLCRAKSAAARRAVHCRHDVQSTAADPHVNDSYDSYPDLFLRQPCQVSRSALRRLARQAAGTKYMPRTLHMKAVPNHVHVRGQRSERLDE